MQVQPYLFFDGRCEEAIEFYKRARCRGDHAHALQGEPRSRPRPAWCRPAPRTR